MSANLALQRTMQSTVGWLLSAVLLFAWTPSHAEAVKASAKKTSTTAAPASGNLLTAPTEPKKEETPLLGGLFAASGSQNLVDRQDGKFSQSFDFLTRLRLRLSDTYSMGALLSYSADPKDSNGSDWGPTSLSLSRKAFQPGSIFTIAPALTTILPTSKDLRVRQELEGSLGTSVSFGFQKGVLREGFDLGLTITFARLFHRYEEATDGRVNNQYSSRQILSAGYTFGKLGFSAVFNHINGLSYQGALGESFEHSQEISYEISPRATVAIGHSLGGSWLKPNGRESNLDVLDENDSKVYGSITMPF